MAYCETTDLLVGDTRLPTGLSASAFVNNAADEIDAALGFLYETPIAVDSNAVNRPTLLLLKSINMWLATGRIILTISRTGEDNTLDALGRYYVNLAMQRLGDIVNGKIDLLGAIRTTTELDSFVGPTIINAEEKSLVDAFYQEYNPGDGNYWNNILGRRALRPGPTI